MVFQNDSKSGFMQMGYVNNKNDYLSYLRNMASEEVNETKLKKFIDNEIENNNVLFFDNNSNETKDENKAAYKMVKTGFTGKRSKKDLYGSFRRTGETKWTGVLINTKEAFILQMQREKDNYRMGLIHFDSKEKAELFINDLHDILLPGEKWSFTSSPNENNMKTKFPILESYIKNVYLKLTQDFSRLDDNQNTGKLIFSNDDKYLLFNSGLLNKYVQEICILGENYSVNNTQKTICKNATVVKNKRELISKFKFKNEKVQEWPKMVEFFSNIDQVIFKAGRVIDMDYEKLNHIIEQRMDERWPAKYQNMFNEGKVEQISKDLSDAINNALMIAKRNYKYIIPQFRPTDGTIQFLMPIYLSGDYANTADFALVLSYDKETEYYVPETVLNLDDAYNNARLIAKPDDLWLNPERIVSTSNLDQDNDMEGY